MTGSAHIIRANSLRIPLASASVHLAITSPPYFGLRSYRDGGEHYDAQIGSEATPEEHLRALWAVADEVWRTLVDWGSYFVNYGEKYSQSGGHNNAGISGGPIQLQGWSQRAADFRSTRRNAPDSYVKNPEWARPKSLMGLPWAFALGMIHPELYRNPIDPPEPGQLHPRWILRAEIVWDKPNGLPESVTDRVRRSHETILHFTKQPHYYSAVDEIREQYSDDRPLNPMPLQAGKPNRGTNPAMNGGNLGTLGGSPLGKLPGSVWEIASEPLKLPTWRVVVAGRTTQWFEPRTAPKPKPSSDSGILAPTGRTAELRRCLGGKVPQPPPRDMAYEYALRYMRAMGTTAGRPSLRPVSPHFAAFPTRLPELIIRGWSPPAICTVCGEGRRPVVGKGKDFYRGVGGGMSAATLASAWGMNSRHDKDRVYRTEATILGYACACTPYTDHPERRRSTVTPRASDLRLGAPATGKQHAWPDRDGSVREYHFAGWTPPPTRPSVVLDPFVGTGTTCLVAKTLGRIGIGVDLSHSYCEVAEWRCASGQGAKAEQRTWREAQSSLF